MNKDQDQAVLLDQFLEAVRIDAAATVPPGLDRRLGDVARTTVVVAQELTATPPPLPAVQARIWQEALTGTRGAVGHPPSPRQGFSAFRGSHGWRWALGGLTVGLLMVGTLILLGGGGLGWLPAPPAAAAELLQKVQAAGTFVPAGKVRHIVTTHTMEGMIQPQGWQDEIWLTNGASHLLLWKPAITTLDGRPLPPFLTGQALLVDEQNIWDFALQNQTVYRRPYSPGPITAQLPSQTAIEKLLKQATTRIVGTEQMAGRSVVVVAGHVGTIVSGSPLEIAEGTTTGYYTATHDYQLWVDSQTYQIVQEQHYIRPASGSPNPAVLTTTTRITQDELLDERELSPDLFRFQLPAGASVVDVAVLPTPSPQPWHTDWYEFVSAAGGFAVLMPRTPDEQSYSAGMQMFGAKHDSVAYVVTYLDYPATTINQVGPDKWLDRERDYVVARSQGHLEEEQSLTLNSFPGRALTSTDPDGRLRRTRLYLVKNRLYTVYAVTPDPTTGVTEVERFLNSFRLLAP